MGILKFNLNSDRRRKEILRQASKEGNVIYGAQAISKQIGSMARPTFDFDIYSKKPSVSALKTKQAFDKLHRRDDFFVKKAAYGDTRKVIYKGADGKANTKDDIHLVDYTRMRKQKDSVIINGVKYMPLKNILKSKKKIIGKKEFAYRHPKDASDIARIKFRRNLL